MKTFRMKQAEHQRCSAAFLFLWEVFGDGQEALAGCRLFDSHALGEVSGLIHVFAEIVGHFIAEQLHGREAPKRR